MPWTWLIFKKKSKIVLLKSLTITSTFHVLVRLSKPNWPYISMIYIILLQQISVFDIIQL